MLKNHKTNISKDCSIHSRRHCIRRIRKRSFSTKLTRTLFFFLLFIFGPVFIQASDIKGRFNISDYYSRDNNSVNNQVLSSKLRVYKEEEEKSGAFFNFDGEYRIKINDLNEDFPEDRINELWLGYKFYDNKISFIAGRQYIYELYSTYIDGVNVRYEIEKGLGLGAFGGLAPDKFDNSFNPKYKSIGLYGFSNQEMYQINMGYERQYYMGKTDREYFSGRLNAAVKTKLRLDASSSVSVNQITNKIELENAAATVSYAYSKELRFQFSYDYYRTIKFFESSKKFLDAIDITDTYFLDTNSQSRTSVRIDYKIARGLNLYLSAAYQQRKAENDHAVRYTGGFTKYDLFGFDVSGRYTHADNFSSKSDEFNIDVTRNLFDKVDVSVYANKGIEQLDIEGAFTTGSLTYGVSVYWPISKHYSLTTFAESYEQEDYTNTSVFTQIGYRF